MPAALCDDALILDEDPMVASCTGNAGVVLTLAGGAAAAVEAVVGAGVGGVGGGGGGGAGLDGGGFEGAAEVVAGLLLTELVSPTKWSPPQAEIIRARRIAKRLTADDAAT